MTQDFIQNRPHFFTVKRIKDWSVDHPLANTMFLLYGGKGIWDQRERDMRWLLPSEEQSQHLLWLFEAWCPDKITHYDEGGQAL